MPDIAIRRMGVGVQLTCTICGASAIVTADWQARRFQQHHAYCTGATLGYYGAGDAVAALARPIARAIGADPDCAPCRQRRGWLNRLVPALWRR